MIDQFILNTSAREKQREADIEASDNTLRSIAKTISWRVIGTIDTIFISWLITGALSLALSIGLIELVTKMILYFFHERLWNTIKWGK